MKNKCISQGAAKNKRFKTAEFEYVVIVVVVVVLRHHIDYEIVKFYFTCRT
jgi:hypothetical protein